MEQYPLLLVIIYSCKTNHRSDTPFFEGLGVLKVARLVFVVIIIIIIVPLGGPFAILPPSLKFQPAGSKPPDISRYYCSYNFAESFALPGRTAA